jgi:hypothetical protein
MRCLLFTLRRAAGTLLVVARPSHIVFSIQLLYVRFGVGATACPKEKASEKER